MNEQLSQSDKTVDVRPSPALRFVKGSTKTTESKTESNRDNAEIKSQESGATNEPKKQDRKPKSAKLATLQDKITQIVDPPSTNEEQDNKPMDVEPTASKSLATEKLRHAYEPFSTRVRQDLKRRLKRLSHYREDSGHEVFKVQHLVEEAILQWLALQDEPENGETKV